VPAKLSARARLFDTGHNRKTDAHDAHAVAVVAVRTQGLRVVSYDEGRCDAPSPRSSRASSFDYAAGSAGRKCGRRGIHGSPHRACGYLWANRFGRYLWP
jgi:hypothetical protein